MISDPKNLTEQLQNLSERIAIEMRALNRTKVSKINGAIPDNNGEVTIANATTSTSGLMSASDKTKLGGIAEGANNYSLPTASSSVLGGVKTGSNITNTNGTISITKSNVTGALGYTPLQTAPVTSVNGQTGAVSVDVGVKTVNGTQPDPDGNVTIQTGGDTSNLVPKTGDRGLLAGYESSSFVGGDLLTDASATISINESSPDVTTAFMADITVKNGASYGWFDWFVAINMGEVLDYPTKPCTSWTKVVVILEANTVTLSSLWRWKDNVAPSISPGILVLHWNGDFGTACFIDCSDGFMEIIEEKFSEYMG